MSRFLSTAKIPKKDTQRKKYCRFHFDLSIRVRMTNGYDILLFNVFHLFYLFYFNF